MNIFRKNISIKILVFFIVLHYKTELLTSLYIIVPARRYLDNTAPNCMYYFSKAVYIPVLGSG